MIGLRIPVDEPLDEPVATSIASEPIPDYDPSLDGDDSLDPKERE
jgi:hypothetical protein